MDFIAAQNTINEARALFAQARKAHAAQEETAAVNLMNTCVKMLCAMHGDALSSEEIAGYLDTDIGTYGDFHEELNAAVVRQAFMNAARSARKPEKALKYLDVIEATYRTTADEDVSFDEFCHEAGIEARAVADLKAEISDRLENAGWQSAGTRLANFAVSASLKKAFSLAAEYSATKPARALKLLNAIEWVAGKMGGPDEKRFYNDMGLDAGLIARVRNQTALKL